jgi:predicted nucleotidyltransferase
MAAHVIHPTPYPDVNAVLNVLLSSVQTILGDHFIGMYLYGSLASGDFNPETSDIDFLVVTADEIPDEMVRDLEAMHIRLMSSDLKWAIKLEGAYIPQHAIRRHVPNNLPRPCINEGSFYLAPQGSDWIIQRHIIREQGVVLAGPTSRTLIDPVEPKDIRWAVLAFLNEWWAPMLEEPKRLHSSEYQAYAIVTMCRVLYTLEHGTIVSKPVSARWAQEALGEDWAGLIEQALAWRHDEQLDKFNKAVDFIRYTVERGQQFEMTTEPTRRPRRVSGSSGESSPRRLC